MKAKPSKIVQSIFQLHSGVESLFFREFMHDFDMPKGMNSTHMRTLLMLNFNEGCPMSNVSQMLSLEKGSFTPVANKLMKLGFITRKQSETDRRIHKLFLTEEGKALATDFANKHMAYIESLLDGLGDEKKATFVENIDMINQTINDLSPKNMPTFMNISQK